MSMDPFQAQQQQKQPVRREGPQAALPQSVPTQQTENYEAGQKLFKDLQWTLNQKAGSSKITSTDAAGARTYNFETFKYQDPCSRCQCSKYLFVNDQGQLKEFAHNGTYNSKGQPNGAWVDSKATQYFLVGNVLLNEKGQKLGEVALHPSNNKIEDGQTFVKGSFTFKDNNGCVRCVDASQLCNTGLSGMPAGVVRLGMPPKVELEAHYELKSRHHLVDTNNRCYQYGVKYSDKEHSAYEVKIVPKSDKNKISLKTSEIDRLYSDKAPEKLELKSDNGTSEVFYVKKEADGIYLSRTKGGETVARIRNLTESPAARKPGDPAPYDEVPTTAKYSLERAVSTKTYFWDCYKCGDLAVAKGGWVEDKNFNTINDTANIISPAEIEPTEESTIKPRAKSPAPTPKDLFE